MTAEEKLNKKFEDFANVFHGLQDDCRELETRLDMRERDLDSMKRVTDCLTEKLDAVNKICQMKKEANVGLMEENSYLRSQLKLPSKEQEMMTLSQFREIKGENRKQRQKIASLESENKYIRQRNGY